ncbi:hypothetical protein R3P38DRAFT_3289711 [Favolaschia claudopus]|uniref:Uncharacterized protein n=1 Tax=Favolaschia claudopus TaxID=2862362 RepID=A0AAV9ZUC3_9AGAR
MPCRYQDRVPPFHRFCAHIALSGLKAALAVPHAVWSQPQFARISFPNTTASPRREASRCSYPFLVTVTLASGSLSLIWKHERPIYHPPASPFLLLAVGARSGADFCVLLTLSQPNSTFSSYPLPRPAPTQANLTPHQNSHYLVLPHWLHRRFFRSLPYRLQNGVFVKNSHIGTRALSIGDRTDTAEPLGCVPATWDSICQRIGVVLLFPLPSSPTPLLLALSPPPLTPAMQSPDGFPLPAVRIMLPEDAQASLPASLSNGGSRKRAVTPASGAPRSHLAARSRTLYPQHLSRAYCARRDGRDRRRWYCQALRAFAVPIFSAYCVRTPSSVRSALA